MNPVLTAPSQRRVATAAEAETLLDEVIDALGGIEETLSEETGLMQAGRIRDALDLTDAKQARAGAYMRLLETVKANAIILARFAPDGVETLKVRHSEFALKLRLNQAVLATVKSVAETLVRGVQEEMSGNRQLSVYGPGISPRGKNASATPLALSVRL
ncbi:hypothetical protein [Terrarubrum flagellatum]|uniref:hypothetical protein n=1 Tax=Terrirubrum flagellatum TaxID=2895980 RepID=UPI0031457053